MARTQAKLLTTIWTDPDWLALTSAAQRLYLVLLSQPKLTIAGCLDVLPERWANLSADTSEEDVRKALAELHNARYIVLDGDELVIRTFVTHDLGSGTVNGNLVKGMWSAWASIISPVLRKVVVDEMPPQVYGRDGVEVPDLAKQLRSEPRFEPQPVPQSEPSVDLLPSVCSLPTATDTSLRTTPVAPAPDPSHDVEQVAAAPDEQEIRKTAALVGRVVASAQVGLGNPSAYAAAVTRQILDTTGDGIDRERITRLLTAGDTPEGIASGWATDPFGFPATSEPDPTGPDTAGFYAASEARRQEQMSEQAAPGPVANLAGARAARDALRKVASA